MAGVTFSIWAGVSGVLAGALALTYFRGRLGSPERYWLVGVAAVAPAWVIALTVLLGGLSGEDPDKTLKAFLAASSACALLGVIVTEFCARRLQLRSPVLHWLLGAAALMPSWGLILWRVW